MAMFHNTFHGFLSWILNGKENKEVSNICCEVRILEKKKPKTVFMEQFILIKAILTIGLELSNFFLI